MRRGLVVAAACCAVAACSKEQPGETGKAPAGSSAAGSPATATSGGKGGGFPASMVASCAGFTAAAGAEFLGVPPADVKDSSIATGDYSRECRFASTTEPKKKVGFQLIFSDTVEAAIADMAQSRDNYKLAYRTPARQGAEVPFEEIAGVGDEAFWTAINGFVVMRRGNLTFTFTYPYQDKKGQIELARKVVAGMPK
ncbi:MAG TPA: hypothetical protein VKE22_07835 [Haliangiales bacterium]|nr:hypothetical protein [Haliangiales bacterium]